MNIKLNAFSDVKISIIKSDRLILFLAIIKEERIAQTNVYSVVYFKRFPPYLDTKSKA